MQKLILALLLANATVWPVWAAPPEIRNGGDNGGSSYVDGVNQPGDTLVDYQDIAPTPNSARAVSNRVSVKVVLPLVKEIRDLTGTQIAHAAILYKGQEIYYVLYIWNRLPDQSIADLRMSDVLPAGVTYTGPIEIFTGILSGGTPAGNPLDSLTWTSASNWQGLGWSIASGQADIGGSILSVGSPTHAQLNLNAREVLAVRFRVRIN